MKVTDLVSGTVFGTTPTSLPTGFYRIESLGGTQTVSYQAHYGDFSYKYYNDAGHLVVSVAPKGVVFTSTHYPDFTTRYEYNAKGQLLREGDAQFIYRKDGSLRFSQNAQQRADRRFAYTHYDRLGRNVEVGVYQMPQTISDTISLDDQLSELWPSQKATILEDKTRSGGLYTNGVCSACSEQVNTWYDRDFNDADALVLGTFKQRFVLGKVAKTQNAAVTSWYSYDELGRVEWLVQSLAGLGTKTVEYTYQGLGGIAQVAYQKGQSDAFYHHYRYDADQRLVQVQTSRDGLTKVKQAKYEYYTHGPLKRVELADGLQGIDYVYTVQGWLKSLNHAEQSKDPGRDGASGQPNAAFAPDAFGMTLEYFSGDYTRSGTGIASMATGANPSYNGNVQTLSWQSRKPSSVVTLEGPGIEAKTAYRYQYDQKNQLTEASWGTPDFTSITPTFTPNALGSNGGAYRSYGYRYDAHGNLQALKQNNKVGSLTDDFTYRYDPDTDLLTGVEGYGTSYSYNAIGELTAETGGTGAKYLAYNAYGLVTSVYADAAKTQLLVSYFYDEAGQRVKQINHSLGITTYYVRDAEGQVLGVYDNEGVSQLSWKEVSVFGADRLGTYRPADGITQYELTDHLGNVRVLVGRQTGALSIFRYTDYFPFGAMLRIGGVGYRYDYQGQFAEKDAQTGWNSFEKRLYDARIGRWLSTDPEGQYHWVVLGNPASPSFTTTYHYNAAGELLKTTDPEQGTAELVYRKDGTLRFSQDAQQKQDRKFSYSNYDRGGRTLESGVYQMGATTDPNLSFAHQLSALFGSEAAKALVLEDKTRSGGLNPAQCSEQTSTWYDLPFDGSYAPNGTNAELGSANSDSCWVRCPRPAIARPPPGTATTNWEGWSGCCNTFRV